MPGFLNPITAAGNESFNNSPETVTRDRFTDRLAKLQDPNSELYRNAEVGLMKLLNQATPTVATLTSAQRAGGLSVGSASAIGNKQREASETKNREKASMASGQLFQRNQELINNILNSSANFETQMAQIDEMARQFDEQMDASFWNSIVNGVIGIGAIALAPATGGASLAAGGLLMQQNQGRNIQPSLSSPGSGADLAIYRANNP